MCVHRGVAKYALLIHSTRWESHYRCCYCCCHRHHHHYGRCCRCRRRCSKQLIWILHIWPSVFINWKLENISPESANGYICVLIVNVYGSRSRINGRETARMRLGDDALKGSKELFSVCSCCSPASSTNQSKHWRIIVGFMSINKIPFRSNCSAHAIFGGGSSFIHAVIDRLAFHGLVRRDATTFNFSFQNIDGLNERKIKSWKTFRDEEKIMDYLTCVHVLFIVVVFMQWKMFSSVAFDCFYPPKCKAHHHIATHSRLVAVQTKNTILFTIYWH